ncbi:R3H domain-containing nucleic acid-binding protein, partial [Pseudodesulfovibrio sp.]|uniref:Jag family protein n=1 Tax=Pseudodesulfovibrio sp. TaxID=2035812 RepID=UPI0026359E9F
PAPEASEAAPEAPEAAPAKVPAPVEAPKAAPVAASVYEDDHDDGPAPGNAIEPEEYDDINGNVVEPEYDPANDVNGNVFRDEPQPRERKGGRERKPRPERKPREAREPRESRESRPKSEKPRRERKPPRPERKPRPEVEEDFGDEQRPTVDMSEFDPAVLEAAVREVMSQLLTPIVGEAKVEVTIESDRVKVFIDDEENSGLIIGREGQTLSSLQYLVNRLVSRKMEASVRIQVDTGDYRERQDDKLRQIALHLAGKAADLGRTQSTKPLSSYHRRVVHLALQENEEVFTRSKGEGPMKRVLIVPKSRKNGGRQRY